MEPEEPVPGIVYTASLREAPQEAIDSFIETAWPDSSSPLLAAELRQCGGAVASRRTEPGRCHTCDAEYVFCGIGLPMSPEMGEAITKQIDTVCKALEPWSTASCYFNFADRPTDLEAIFAPETLERALATVKRRYDPDGLISGNHNISLA